MSFNSACRKKFKKIFRSTWGYEKLLRPINKTGGYASFKAASERQAKNNGRILKLTAMAVLAGLALLAPGGRSFAQDTQQHVAQEYDFDIDEETLGPALEKIVQQTNLVILYPFELAGRTGINPVNGRYSVSEALDILLRGTPFSGGLTESGNMYVSLSGQQTRDLEGKMAQGNLKKTLLAGAAAFLYGTGAYGADVALIDDQEEKPETTEKEKDVVVVTGTRIVGVNDQFSPVTSFDNDAMDLAGFRSVADLLETLPQNFGGGVTPDTTQAGSFAGVGGAAVNLRGLGNGATLTLIDGARLPVGGPFGSFIDISAIPQSAVERVDVLADGSSAIYGSDAIAGVVNIILRDDYDGAETRVQLGKVTDGGGGTIAVGQSIGISGEHVGGLLSYQYQTTNELELADKGRPETYGRSYLLPSSESHSVFGRFKAEAPSERISFTASGYYNNRDNYSLTTGANCCSVIQTASEYDVEQAGANATVQVNLGGDWAINVSGGWARESSFLSIPSENITFSRFSLREYSSISSVSSVDATIGGPLFSVTDEPAKFVIGGGYRSESVDYDLDDLAGARHSFSAYGEIYVPLITSNDSIPGVNRLAVSAAGRYDDYSDVGSAFIPKVGIAWEPIDGFNVRGTYGRSFRAPTIAVFEAQFAPYYAILSSYIDPDVPGGVSPALLWNGFGEPLGPEKAETITAGFDFTPPSMDGLTFRATYFVTDYVDRVGAPSVTTTESFEFKDYFGNLIRNPDSSLVQSIVDGAIGFYDFSPSTPGGPLSLSDVTVLLNTGLQNLAISKVAGVDLTLDYSIESKMGNWNASISSSILTKAYQQAGAGLPQEVLLDTYYNPVDWKLRGGISWNDGPLTIALFGNYTDNYIDDEAMSGPVPVDSWTTIDSSISVDVGGVINSNLAKNTLLIFTISNMLNTDPPNIGYTLLREWNQTYYDAANSDPAGRRVGLLLKKEW